jgi:hypothetical protein
MTQPMDRRDQIVTTEERPLKLTRALAPGNEGRARALTTALVVALVASLACASVALGGKTVDRFFPQAGTSGGQAGQFNMPRGIAIDQASPAGAKDGWKYVTEELNNRVQAFNGAHDPVFQWAIGRDVVKRGGVGNVPVNEQQRVTLPAATTGGTFTLTWVTGTGTGTVTNGSNTLTAVNTTTGAFRVGDTIAASGIPANATITAVGAGTLTISANATSTGANRLLTARETTTGIASNASAGDVEAALTALPAIEAGEVAVTSSAALTWTVEFKGAYADTDVPALTGTGTNLTVSSGSKNFTPATAVPGSNSFEKCTVASDCKAGVSGTQGGMFASPQGVALNQTTGHFYVRERGTNRVQEFDADGGFVGAWGWDTITNGSPSDPGGVTTFQVCTVSADCKSGVFGGGAGQFASASEPSTGIAVNPVSGNVYVADPGGAFGSDGQGKRIQEFEPDGDVVRLWGWDVVSSGPGDVSSDSFEICVPANGDVCRGGDSPYNSPTSPTNGAPGKFDDHSANPRHLAIDSAGVIYASDGVGSNRVQRFDTTQTSPLNLLMAPIDVVGLTGTADAETTGLFAGAGSLFVARSAAVGVLEIAAPGSAAPGFVGAHLTPATNFTGLAPNGVALDVASGDLYVPSNDSNAHRVYILDDDGAAGAPDATILPPSDIGATTAAFQATINPQGFPTDYRFQYSRNGIDWTDVAPDQSLGAGTDDIAVDDAVSGLDANTNYRLRLVVTRGFGNGSVTSLEQVFLTDAIPPEIVDASAGAIKQTSAILTGSINPHGTPTEYRFEYGEGISYGKSIPVPDATVGSGHQATFVKQAISGLQSDRTYHYRIVATSQTEGATIGPDHVFRTSDRAPEGRAFELVSPADKIGGGGVGSYAANGFRGTGAGTPSYDGERVVVRSTQGSPLLNGKFEYASDAAFCGRAGDSVGWECHSPFTHPNYTPAARRFAGITAVSEDLSLMMWGSNTGHIGVFPELASYPDSFLLPHISDWSGKWEVAGPTDVAQGDLGGDQAVSPDGGYAVVQGAASAGYVGGLSGADDPYLDRVNGGATYILDVTAGLSDSFPGAAIREPVGVCTPGTEIPSVDGGGGITGRPCPSPVEYEPGKFRSGALVSSRGTLLGSGNLGSDSNRISRGGARVFFTDQSSGAPSSCTGTDASTSCPPQLYVRQRNTDGTVSVRWISRPEVADQDASLLATAVYVGATPDGDKAFFTSAGPLTADDRNGTSGSPVANGVPSVNSVDLFMFDFPDDPDADPALGDLVRLSAGPTGAADCNVSVGGARAISRDGESVYFVCADDLAGADASPPAGGITTPDGTGTGTTDLANLYRYQRAGGSEQWTFVAQLPTQPDGINPCATVSRNIGGPLDIDEDDGLVTVTTANCVRGSEQGDLLSFMTRGKVTADDPDGTSADIYVFDADADKLIRISAVAGGRGGSYDCLDAGFDEEDHCHAEMSGRAGSQFFHLIPDPPVADDRAVFFQSPVRLTPDDDDDAFDVYEWRNGSLSLFTPGTERDVYYTGNSVDGQDVFVEALDRLSWQDKDAVMDVYDARVGGGIPDPPPPAATCAVLVGQCQSGGVAPPTSPRIGSEGAGGGNALPTARGKLVVAGLSAKARRRAARSGVISIRARSSRAGTVRATARALVGGRTRTVARAATRLVKPGSATLRLRLSRTARSRLASGRRLRLSVAVTAPRAYEQELTVTLKRGGK